VEANEEPNVIARKKASRKELLTTLKALTPEERREGDALIRRRLMSIPSYQQAETLFAFVGDGWEVDTWPLIEDALAAGKRVAVPLCVTDTSERAFMRACLIRGREDLSRTQPWGLWEPEPGPRNPVIDPSDIDFAIIPCVACDSRGRRLGRGGGFYDRFLAGSGFVKAALCRDIVFGARIPTEPHDAPVDFVVTESRVIDTAKERDRTG